jgi:hypothetical protein
VVRATRMEFSKSEKAFAPDFSLRTFSASLFFLKNPPACAKTRLLDAIIFVRPYQPNPHRGRVAQLAEQLTLNQ